MDQNDKIGQGPRIPVQRHAGTQNAKGTATDGKSNAITVYPNPFSQTTVIEYTLDATSKVALVVTDMNGKVITTLVDGTQKGGSHAATFNANDLPSGNYLYTLKTDDTVQSGKLTIVK